MSRSGVPTRATTPARSCWTARLGRASRTTTVAADATRPEDSPSFSRWVEVWLTPSAPAPAPAPAGASVLANVSLPARCIELRGGSCRYLRLMTFSASLMTLAPTCADSGEAYEPREAASPRLRWSSSKRRKFAEWAVTLGDSPAWAPSHAALVSTRSDSSPHKASSAAMGSALDPATAMPSSAGVRALALMEVQGDPRATNSRAHV
jgi:hypothetical protein